MPQPAKAPEQNVVVLPAQRLCCATSRRPAADAAGKLAAGAGKDPNAGAGTYVVKPGDSLAKIAKETGAKIDDLKAANNLPQARSASARR